MDIVNQIADTDEEEAASGKERDQKEKVQKTHKTECSVPSVLYSSGSSRCKKRYVFARAEKMSCKFCDRPPTFPYQDRVVSPHDGRARR